MRSALLWIALFLLCSLPTEAQRGHPIQPGLREAEKAESLPLEPPRGPMRRDIHPAQVKRDANELKRLVDALPPEIEQVTKGELPKDLNENLKKIEKLARRLRSEVFP